MIQSKFSTRSCYTFAILLLTIATIASQIPTSNYQPNILPTRHSERREESLFPYATPSAVPLLSVLRQGTASAVPFNPRLLGALAPEGLLTFTTHAADKSNSVFSPDKGKLNILLDGKSVGREEFSIEPTGATWTAKGKSSLQTPDGKSAVVTGTLILNPDGSPVSYDWVAQADKTNSAHVTFVNGTAKTTLQMQGAHPFDQENSFGTPRITVLDNNLYHQYIVLARVYDWTRRGTQSFPVLIPQELTPGTISVDWAGAVTAEGKSYEGLKVTTSDIEVILYLDSNHKLIRLEVPSAKVSVIRE